MRLFISIEMPEEIKEYLGTIQQNIDFSKDKVKWVSPNQMHLTLKFLGKVQTDKVKDISAALRQIKVAPFSVNLGNIGVFPSEDYIRVIWVSLNPEKEILELQKNIDENLKTLFEKEKDFKAHITLARVKYIENKEDFIAKLKNIKIESKKIDINNFKLMKSTLTPLGPVYDEVEVFG